MLTAVRLRQLVMYDPMTGVFSWRQAPSARVKVGSTAGDLTRRGYWRIGIDGRRHLAHRLAWLYAHGAWPLGEIDHLNGIRTDNRLSNLRDVSTTVNRQNVRASRRGTKAGLLGVITYGQRFEAAIRVGGKQLRLGRFATAIEAHTAYLTAKRQLHEGNTL